MISQTKEAIIKYPETIMNEIVGRDLEKVDARTAFDAQKLGDEIADRVVRKYIEYLADGVMNIVNTLFPEVIVVGGGVGNEGENLFVPLREAMKAREYTHDVPATIVKGAEMGNKAGIVGAAMLGKKR